MKAIGPTVKAADQRVVKVEPKSAEPFYLSAEWRTLRHACLQRDGWRCVMPGCGKPAIVADHIIARRDGGPDELANLRSLCRTHDNRLKEDASGARRETGGRGV